jgi:hypothetical protein
MSQQQLDAFIGMVRADPAWQQEMEGAKLRHGVQPGNQRRYQSAI